MSTLATQSAESPFRPYSDIPTLAPQWLWWVARCVVLGGTLAVLTALLLNPDKGVTAFWQIVIPSLPLVFAVMPGVWRQVCPMALLNQLPVRFGFSAQKTLPLSMKENSYLYATLLFIALVGLKHVSTYNSPMPLFIMLVAALAAALLGGIIFKGRSGWCGTFCPLGPLQKVYGHTPPLIIKNGYCETGCVGCQKNCYDFSPRSALFGDLYDKDPWYAGHRRFFVGILPGLIIAFWLGRSPEEIGIARYVQELLTWLLLSAGSFFILTSVLRTSVYRIAAIYGVVAIFLYYWFAAPVMIEAIRQVFNIALPDALAYAIQGTVVLVAWRNLADGFALEKAYHAMQAGGATPARRAASAPTGAPSAGGTAGAAAGAKGLTERSTGKAMTFDPSKSMLELMEAADLKIDYGCRTGMCGADPIVIEEGAENLTPPTPTETATLRRLGLEGKARLACVCRPTGGPVTINLAADPHSVAAPGPTAPAEDLAQIADVGRVVIVGNGVAGVTAADRIRQASPSCHIDVITRERHHFYNRMAIGRAIYGRTAMEGLSLLPANWDKTNNINVWLNTIVRDVDRASKTVVLGTGQQLQYDKLILATGGRPAIPPVAGADLPGCFVLREAEDALRIRAWAQEVSARRAIVVGGGVLGVEAADALYQLGLDVTIIHRSTRLMDRNLDAAGAARLNDHLQAKGMSVALGSEIDSLAGEGRLQGARLKDSRTLTADICVFCIGVRGETALAEGAGLDVNRGIIVDAAMRTSDPDIYAIGDVAEFGSGPSGLWTLGTQHAQIATDHLLKRREGSAVPRMVMKLKMEDFDVVTYGQHDVERLGQEEIADGEQVVPALDARAPATHRKLVIENGRIVGAVFVGPKGTADGVADLIASERDVSSLLPDLRAGRWEALAAPGPMMANTNTSAALNTSEGDAALRDAAALNTSGRADDTQGRASWSGPLGWGVAMVCGALIAGLGSVGVGLVEPNMSGIEAARDMMSDALEPKLTSPTVLSGSRETSGTKAEPRVQSARGNGQLRPQDDTPGTPDNTRATRSPAPDTQAAPTTRSDRGTSAATVQPDAARRSAGTRSVEGHPPEGRDGATGQTLEDRGRSTLSDAPSIPTRPDRSRRSAGPAPADEPAAPRPLEGAALADALVGRAISGGSDFGSHRFRVTLSPSGRATGTFMDRAQFGSRMTDTGRWSVRGNQLCVRFSLVGGGRQRCVQAQRRGNDVVLSNPGGRGSRWALE